MVTGISVEQAADHPLVLGAVTFSFTLEEFDAAFRECNSYFDPFLSDGEFSRIGEKVRNDLKSSKRLVSVLNFRGHRCVCPFASNRHQRFE